MGAWIETIRKMVLLEDMIVAPHVGAWIETYNREDQRNNGQVAPHVGAWIETLFGLIAKFEKLCRAPRGRVD